MIDITTCRYTTLIKNYKSLNTPDAILTKTRIEYLYNMYITCSDKQRNKFIEHIEKILDSRLFILIRLENPDRMAELGKDIILWSKNKERLGECLPIILVLEKELRNMLEDEKNDDDISIWLLNYLKKYDSRLHVDKEIFDEYDVLYEYSKLGCKRAKIKMGIYGLKIAAIFEPKKEK